MKMQVLQTMRPKSDCSELAINRENDSYVKICRHCIIVNFFSFALFPLSSLVTGPSFMSILSLVLGL